MRVQPRAIIAGALELFASPADYDDWAEAVKKQGIELFRQERTGAVHGSITASQLELKAFLNGQAYRAREGQSVAPCLLYAPFHERLGAFLRA